MSAIFFNRNAAVSVIITTQPRKGVSSRRSNIYIYMGSVSIVTDYRLDSPGSNPGGDEIFRQSRLALGPIQPPIK